jgi:hypothetical protein
MRVRNTSYGFKCNKIRGLVNIANLVTFNLVIVNPFFNRNILHVISKKDYLSPVICLS